MNIHEYQAKEILRSYGVAVPRGYAVKSAAQAEKAAKDLGTPIVVVKAQVHAGGRGKAGGVKVCKSPAEAKQIAERLLGTRLVTHQTTAEGQPVNEVYVEEGSSIARELYMAILIDRASAHPVLIASTEGGMDIEEVAEKHPHKIVREMIDPSYGLIPFQARNIAVKLGIKGDGIGAAASFILGLYQVFVEKDCAMLEINPLVETKEGKLIALDCKISFDDNALFRHPDVLALRDLSQSDKREADAAEHDLNYIALDGTIGCMVNGAGLAMATMDIIKHYGGSPANFLDVGGGATEEKVTAAFKIILSDPKVKGILVNIFGGIMKCDVIANGIIAAAKLTKLKVPLVVRLEGTNVQLGKEILAKSGLPIESADTLADAAEKIVRAAAKSRAA